MYRVIAVIFLLSAAIVASAQELPTTEVILGKLDTANDNLKSFEAKFHQVELDVIIASESITEGKLYFQSPGQVMMHRRIGGKVVEEVGKNTEIAWRIRHKVKAVDQFKLEAKEGEEDFSITSVAALREHFSLEVVGIDELQTGKAFHLVGKPKQKRKQRKVELWINLESAAPLVKLVTHERSVKTTFELSEIQRNSKMDSGIFEFTPPTGYNIKKH